MITHELKILEKYAIRHEDGDKNWELRKNDRDFQSGDHIIFKVIDENGQEIRSYFREIYYVFNGGKYGLKNGYCILSISEYENDEHPSNLALEN